MIFFLCCILLAFTIHDSVSVRVPRRTFSNKYYWIKVYDEPEEELLEPLEILPQVGIPVLSDETVPSYMEKKTIHGIGIEKCVEDANMYRRQHKGTNDMAWDEELAKEAQQWAEYLAKESWKKNKNVFHAVFKHTTYHQRHGHGENLFWSVGTCRTPGCYCKKADRLWNQEIKNFDFTTYGRKHHWTIGHFTQLVWKGTTRFGIGVGIGKYGKYWDAYKMPQIFVVGRFSPAGNSGPMKKNIGACKNGQRSDGLCA